MDEATLHMFKNKQIQHYKQSRLRDELRMMRNISQRDCKRNYKALGEHYANCVINDKSNLINIGSEDDLKQVILHQKRIDAINCISNMIEDELIEIQIYLDEKYFEMGIESIKENIKDNLSYNKNSESYCETAICSTEQWFEKYDEIRNIRLQRLEKLITWDEMEAQINDLLQIERGELIELDDLVTLC